jgi:DNA repair protein RadC
LKAGAESLTDGELLAVLIRCGTKNYSALELAFALLDRHPVYKGLVGLYHLDMEMLKTIPGIGNVKAIEILCALELSKRLAELLLKKRVILARQSILRPIIWKRCGIFVLKR